MEKKSAKSYIEAIGRRKTSSARVRLTPASKTEYTVNDKPYYEYFPTKELQKFVLEGFKIAEPAKDYAVVVKVQGGGIHSQAEAVRHGIARALVLEDGEAKPKVKKANLLKRDARAKERRKFGLKKARKSPQWSKR